MDPHVTSMEELTEELKQRLLESTQENQALRTDLMELQQNTMLNESDAMVIQQENDTLKLQISTFEDEHDKWQMERTELLQDLHTAQQQHAITKQEEEHWLESAQKQFHKIDKLSKYRRKSVLDLQVSLNKISHLTRQNHDIDTELDELRKINAEYQQKVMRLNQQIEALQVENADLHQQNDFLACQLDMAKETAQKITNDLVSKQLVEYGRSHAGGAGAVSSPRSPQAARISFTPNTNHAMQRNVSYNDAQSVPNSDRMSNGTVSPIVHRRRSRSRSVDSDALMHDMIHVDQEHMHDDDEDEKESSLDQANEQQHAHVVVDIMDEHKLRTQIERELHHQFEQEQKDQKERHEALQRKYKDLQQKYEQNVIENKSVLEMRTDREKRFTCVPWTWSCR